MKKYIWLFILPLLALVACSEDNDGPETPATPLALEKNSVEMDKSESATVQIKTGTAKFDVSASNPDVASATLSGQSVSISAKQYGTCIVTVIDGAGQKATITVTVSSKSLKDTARRFTYKDTKIVFGQTAGWSIARKGDKAVEVVSTATKTSYYIVWKSATAIELRSYMGTGEAQVEQLAVENVGTDEKGYVHYLFTGGELVN